MTFVSDAPLRSSRHLPGCSFGGGFYRVVYTDEAGQRVTRRFDDQAGSDLLLRILPATAEPRAYRDACLDARPATDAGTPDVLDGEWWLSLPRVQAMEEAGITDERDYTRAHRAVEDLVYARDNRQSQGGVRAPVLVKRKKTPQNAHLFRGGRVINIR